MLYQKFFSSEASPVTALTINPHKNFLASALLNGTINIFDLKKAKTVDTLNFNQTQLTALSWSTDGKNLCAGSKDGTLIIYNFLKKELITIHKAHRAITALAMDPHEPIVVSGGEDCAIKFWDFKGKLLRTIEYEQVISGDLFGVSQLCFNNDGLLYAGYFMKHDNLCTINTNGKQQWLNAIAKPIQSLALSHDQKTIFCASDHQVQIISSTEGTTLHSFSFKNKWIHKIFARSKDLLLVIFCSGEIQEIHWKDQKIQTLYEPIPPTNLFTLALSPDKNHFIGETIPPAKLALVLGENNSNNHKKIRTTKTPFQKNSLGFIPGKQQLFVGEKKKIDIYNFEGKPLTSIATKAAILAIEYAEPIKIFIVAEKDKFIRKYDFSGKLLQEYKVKNSPTLVKYNHKKKYLAVSYGKKIDIFTIEGKPINSLLPHWKYYEFITMAWSPSGKYLVAADNGNICTVWTVSDKKIIKEWTQQAIAFSFSETEDEIMCFGTNGTINLYNLKNKETTFYTYEKNGSPPTTALYIPDKDTLIFGTQKSSLIFQHLS